MMVRGLEVAARLPARPRGPERVDPAVAEVPDEQVVAEPAPAVGRPGEPPRGVQRAARCHATVERAVRAEGTDDPEPGAVDLVTVGPAQRVGDVDLAVEGLDAERRVVPRQVRV